MRVHGNGHAGTTPPLHGTPSGRYTSNGPIDRWSVSTQVILFNPICVCAYMLASWKFFNSRIPYEEYCLTSQFGREYVEYKKRTITGIPFIP